MFTNLENYSVAELTAIINRAANKTGFKNSLMVSATKLEDVEYTAVAKCGDVQIAFSISAYEDEHLVASYLISLPGVQHNQAEVSCGDDLRDDLAGTFRYISKRPHGRRFKRECKYLYRLSEKFLDSIKG